MIIIDIPMPNSCYQCPMRTKHYCCAKQKALGNISKGESQRPEWCPLKSIEEEVYHGSMYHGNKF